MNPVIRNIFWLLAEHGSRIILSTLSVSLMARALGVEQYGLLQYTLGLVAAFSSISFICGAEVLVPPLVTATPAERKRLLGNAFVLRQAASVVAYICLLIFAWVAEDRGNILLTSLVGISILLGESFGVVSAWMQAKTDLKPRSILATVALGAKLLCMMVLYKINSFNTTYYAAANIIEPVILAIGFLIIYNKKTKENFFCIHKSMLFELLKRGAPFFIGLIAMFFYQRLATILLKQLSDVYNVGIYSASLVLVAPIITISSILISSLAPTYIYSSNDPKEVYRNIGLITIFMFLAGLLLALFARVTGDYILQLIFGGSFSKSIPVFETLVWVTPLIFMESALNQVFIKEKIGELITIKWISSSIVAAAFYYLLIPKYLALGAVFGYMLGYVFACIFSIFIFFIFSTKKIAN